MKGLIAEKKTLPEQGREPKKKRSSEKVSREIRSIPFDDITNRSYSNPSNYASGHKKEWDVHEDAKR